MFKVASLTNFFHSVKPQNAAIRAYGLQSESKSWLIYAAIAVNAALLMSYLLGVNASASAGYEISEMQKKVDRLNEDQKALNLKLSEITAISALNENFEQAGFVQAGAPVFVTVEKPQTAMK